LRCLALPSTFLLHIRCTVLPCVALCCVALPCAAFAGMYLIRVLLVVPLCVAAHRQISWTGTPFARWGRWSARPSTAPLRQRPHPPSAPRTLACMAPGVPVARLPAVCAGPTTTVPPCAPLALRHAPPNPRRRATRRPWTRRAPPRPLRRTLGRTSSPCPVRRSQRGLWS
jgi:hypothetical protein